VIEQMRSLGWDLDSPLDVEHFLYFDDEGAANDVRIKLTSQGFDSTVQPGAAGPARLTMRRNGWL
jgi:Regulator of ribonuclease activity B